MAVPVISNAACAQTFGPAVLPSTLCTSGAGGRGTCSGDSGGPLAVAAGGQDVLVTTTTHHLVDISIADLI